MNQDVDTVASVISAACAVIGVVIGALGLSRSNQRMDSSEERALSRRAFYSFLLTSSGWVLAVQSFLWIVDPFGPYITGREYFQIAGIMIALPALLVLRAGVSLLDGGKGGNDK